MSAEMLPLMIGGTVLQGAGQIQSANAQAAVGESQQTASNYTAALLAQQAGQVRASAQASEGEVADRTNLLLSTARAHAAASGAGAADPTVAAIEGKIAARGQYDMLSRLYTGEERARGLETQSALDVYTGQQQRAAGIARQRAGYATALGSVLSSGAGLYAKYGMSPSAATGTTTLPYGGVDPALSRISPDRGGIY